MLGNGAVGRYGSGYRRVGCSRYGTIGPAVGGGEKFVLVGVA